MEPGMKIQIGGRDKASNPQEYRHTDGQPARRAARPRPHSPDVGTDSEFARLATHCFVLTTLLIPAWRSLPARAFTLSFGIASAILLGELIGPRYSATRVLRSIGGVLSVIVQSFWVRRRMDRLGLEDWSRARSARLLNWVSLILPEEVRVDYVEEQCSNLAAATSRREWLLYLFDQILAAPRIAWTFRSEQRRARTR